MTVSHMTINRPHIVIVDGVYHLVEDTTNGRGYRVTVIDGNPYFLALVDKKPYLLDFEFFTHLEEVENA